MTPILRRSIPGLIAALAAGWLTGCGGGSGDPGGDETRAKALFTPEKTVQLRDRTGAAPPNESAAQNDARRRAQDRTGWVGRSAASTEMTALDGFVADFSATTAPVSLRRPLLARHGIIVHGAQDTTNRDAPTRYLGAALEQAGIATLTTRAIGTGAIWLRADIHPSGTRPAATATWEGLMLGADRDSLNLLQGEATLTYDFATPDITIRFTDIINLDQATPYRVRDETFADIAVTDDGSWATPARNAPRYLEGQFAGTAHGEAAGLFWTPDMMGSYGARKTDP